MTSPTLLSIVCPVFNEEETVPLFLEHITPHLDTAMAYIDGESDYEIVFVDDGCKDNTARIIADIARDNTRIKLVRFSRNFGKEAALAAGLEHAAGDAAIPIDVDLQDPPELIVDMVKLWQDGAQVVNAKRTDRESDSWLKRKTAGAFYHYFNKIAPYPITPDVGDYRLLDRVVINQINTLKEKNRFMKFIFSWVGFTQATVEYTRQSRIAGKTKFNYWKLWNFALDGITGATTTPLRIWTYIGLLIGGLAIVFAAYIVGRTLIFGIDTPGYASILVAVLLLGSFNLISLGILGEYIGRISEEVKNRPLYIVSETVGVEPAQTEE